MNLESLPLDPERIPWIPLGVGESFITSFGAMEYLGENEEVLRRDTASSLHETYLRFCRDNALEPLDLGGVP